MPWVREESKTDLLRIAYWKFYQLLTVSPYTWGFLPLVCSTGLQQGREAYCSRVASQREETLPSVAPFKILESPYAFSALEILGLGEPLLLMLHIPQMLGQQTKQNKTKENPGYSAYGFYLSLSFASSLLLLASSSTVFHHSRS